MKLSDEELIEKLGTMKQGWQDWIIRANKILPQKARQRKDWKKIEQAYQQIVARLKREVTEEWVEHKAIEVMRLSSQYKSESYRRESVKNFIRSIAKELGYEVVKK